MFPSRQLQLHHPRAARVKDLMLLGKVHQRRRAAIALVIRKLLTVLEHPGGHRGNETRECLTVWLNEYGALTGNKLSEQEWSSQKTIVHHIVQLVLVHHVANESLYNTNGVLRVQCGLILLSHCWWNGLFLATWCPVPSFPTDAIGWIFLEQRSQEAAWNDRTTGWWARATPLKNMKVNWDD